jgi:hypothetical protein
MGKDLFKEAAQKIENSAFVVPITLIYLVMFVVALAIAFEDYSTTLAGYQAIPTRKINEWVIPCVALLPQIGQIGFAYLFVTDTGRGWAILIALALFFADAYTDVICKTRTDHLVLNDLSVTAFVETVIIYTLGSEVMLTLSFGMLIRLLPFAIIQVKQFAARMAAAQASGQGALAFLKDSLQESISPPPASLYTRDPADPFDSEVAARSQQAARQSYPRTGLPNLQDPRVLAKLRQGVPHA